MSAAGPPSSTRERSRFARWLALVACCDRRQMRVFELKSARLYAFGVFVSYAILLVIVRGRDQGDVLADLAHDAFAALTFVVGTLAALGAARAFAQADSWRPLAALAAQRGYDARALISARFAACASRATALIGGPSLALVLLACACGKSWIWGLSTGGALCLYALISGALLTGVARVAAWLSPGHARSSLLLLGLGPSIAALGFPALPSIPGFLSWALARIAELGAHFA